MSTSQDLTDIVSTMDPALMEGEFVFCSLDQDAFDRLVAQPIATFYESEGISVIISRETADAERLEYSYVSRMIKLGVYSSLNLVGLIAAVADQLSHAGISVNPVSAYFHDYLFVPADRAQDAMAALEEMMLDSA